MVPLIILDVFFLSLQKLHLFFCFSIFFSIQGMSHQAVVNYCMSMLQNASKT